MLWTESPECCQEMGDARGPRRGDRVAGGDGLPLVEEELSRRRRPLDHHPDGTRGDRRQDLGPGSPCRPLPREAGPPGAPDGDWRRGSRLETRRRGTTGAGRTPTRTRSPGGAGTTRRTGSRREGRRRRTRTGSSICTGTHGSGWRTGTGITLQGLRRTRRGRLRGRTGWCVGAGGGETSRSAGRHRGTGASPRTGATPSAFAWPGRTEGPWKPGERF